MLTQALLVISSNFLSLMLQFKSRLIQLLFGERGLISEQRLDTELSTNLDYFLFVLKNYFS